MNRLFSSSRSIIRLQKSAGCVRPVGCVSVGSHTYHSQGGSTTYSASTQQSSCIPPSSYRYRRSSYGMKLKLQLGGRTFSSYPPHVVVPMWVQYNPPSLSLWKIISILHPIRFFCNEPTHREFIRDFFWGVAFPLFLHFQRKHYWK